MAISWGGFVNHMRVGIEVWTDGYDTNTPSINVYAAFYVGNDNWPFGDNQTLVTWGSRAGDFPYRNDMGNSQVMHIATHVIAGQGQNYNGGPYYEFWGRIDGIYLGGGPTHGVGFNLPPRPPNVPTNPPVGVDSITTNSARIVVSAADGRGAGVDAYEVAISRPGPDWSAWSQSWGGGTGTATNLQPVSQYEAAARAHNGVGWSGWSYTGAFTTGGTAPATPVAGTISNVTTSGARFTYTAPYDGGSAITGYDIQIATNSGFTTGVQTFADSASPYDITGLTNHGNYWVRFRAKNAIGTGSYGPAVSFTTLMTVTATAPAGSQTPFRTITLTGTDVNDATVSKRQWTQKSGTPTVTLTGATGKTPSFYVPGTLNGATLVFTYTVTDTSNRTYSADASVTVTKAKHRAVIGGAEVPMDFRAS